MNIKTLIHKRYLAFTKGEKIFSLSEFWREKNISKKIFPEELK